MGVFYSQKCIMGVKFHANHLKVIDKPLETVEEPRFDTKTGEQTCTVVITVSPEKYHYSLLGLKDKCFYTLITKIAEKFDLYHTGSYEEEEAIIGFNYGKDNGSYEHGLINSEESFSSLKIDKDKLSEIFGEDKPVSLYLIGSVC